MKYILNGQKWILSFRRQTEVDAPFDKTDAVTIPETAISIIICTDIRHFL